MQGEWVRASVKVGMELQLDHSLDSASGWDISGNTGDLSAEKGGPEMLGC